MTLTKEQIEMYASAADATQTFEMDKGKLIAVEPKHMQELARIALASLEAEAVAYIRDGFRADGVHFCGGIITAEEHERTKPALSDRYNWKHQPLYTAPPAPVVPDIGEIRVGRLPTMNQEDYPGLGDWWVQLRIGEDSDEVLARVYGATPQEANSRAEALACRDAMLQGAAGNSQAIPDGYALVPVELTGAMTNAMTDAILDDLHNVDVWRSVLAAAPQQEVM